MGLSRRNFAAIGILLAWGAAIGWLTVRRSGRSEAAVLRDEAALRLAPGDAWFQIQAGDLPLGIAGITLDTVPAGYRIRETITRDLPRGDRIDRGNRTTEYLMGPDLSLIHLDSHDRLTAQPRRVSLATAAGGWTADYTWGERRVSSTAADRALATALVLVPYRLALTGALAAGDSRSLATLSGWPPAAGTAEYRVTGDTLVIYPDSTERQGERGWQPVHYDSAASRTVLALTDIGPVLLQADRRGTLTGLRYPLGVTWIRTEFNLAHHGALSDSVAAATAARLRRSLPVIRHWATSPWADEPQLDSVIYRVSRRSGERIGASLLRHYAGNGIDYRVERGPDGPIGDLLRIGRPERQRLEPRSADRDPLIQSEAAAIRLLADSLLADSSALVPEALIARFSHIRIDSAAAAARDALGTLTAAAGSSDGRARLLVALMRAAGRPARYVIGVAGAADTLYAHAWTELWSASQHRWIAIDPLTMRPASARLLRLGYAGSSDPDDILQLVADLRLVRVDSAAGPAS